MKKPRSKVPLTEGERRALKIIRIFDKTLQTVLDVVFVLILLLGLYFLADTIFVYNNARAAVTMPYKPEPGEDIQVLKELSEDCIGWITIDDTTIDYPVMQGVDNYEYINKDPYGDYSLAGSIFLDSRNNGSFTDDYSLLYGHHMSGGMMFGALDYFEERDYFDKHLTGTIFTDRGDFSVTVFAYAYTDASNELIFDPESTGLAALYQWIQGNAMHINPGASGHIIALSTCKSPTSTRRVILFVTIDENQLNE